MVRQSPMISIPKKSSADVDWIPSIRNLIAKSYGISPDDYAAECQVLQQCRRDAVKDANSNVIAHDRLSRYFAQLEFLGLRFPEICIDSTWSDAFSNKQIVQTSLAYEKVSILFQIAATQSAIAASQNRTRPEGLKLAFYYFRSCAGLLTYIAESFPHAPSIDLSRDVISSLTGIVIAQATEIFLEKVIGEKTAHTLISKVASQTAHLYTASTEEVKALTYKGVVDHKWNMILQIKSKYFASLAQYYRGLVDDKAGNHGNALVRFKLAESLANEANQDATSFNALFVCSVSSLPVDAGSAILDSTRVHLSLCTERRSEATRENDLIYIAALPSHGTLPAIEKAIVATPVSIQEFYGTPDMQKVTGLDIFSKLIPLNIHKSTSVYMEEKAELIRREVELAESADTEACSALDAIGVQDGLARFKAITEGGIDVKDIPRDMRRWREDIGAMEDRKGVDMLMRELGKLKASATDVLDSVSYDLKSRDRKAMRVGYNRNHPCTHRDRSALSDGSIRSELNSQVAALHAAASSDGQVAALWDSVKGIIGLLISDNLEDVLRSSIHKIPQMDGLPYLDLSSDLSDERKRRKIKQCITDIEDRLKKLKEIRSERSDVLKDLRNKVAQRGDSLQLLLITRQTSNTEPSLITTELERFKFYQQRRHECDRHQQVVLQEITLLWKTLQDMETHGLYARGWVEREKRVKDAVRTFARARDGYMQVQDGLDKGIRFYQQLVNLSETMRQRVKSISNNK
ncbi:BRO1-domain-containing protein [Coniophora puteana RWD-64-598 SS2]|uniref:BRO domain-containing protein 1 n=1 Tax=Coniophora puteana (strain RWD-64-598) TaxID=741705 RepID=A0A5M3N3P8_CONPW|nr:BRO1-domain-containing protein [Coniophora puteana RWD-64-598 SS2]EIW86032.1 BRO1-domain-containing protein [Coniophora puteana RWD-64-598 SS2]